MGNNIPAYIAEWKKFKQNDVVYFIGMTWEGETPKALSNAKGLIIATKGDTLQVDFEGNVQFVKRCEVSYKKRLV